MYLTPNLDGYDRCNYASVTEFATRLRVSFPRMHAAVRGVGCAVDPSPSVCHGRACLINNPEKACRVLSLVRVPMGLGRKNEYKSGMPPRSRSNLGPAFKHTVLSTKSHRQSFAVKCNTTP